MPDGRPVWEPSAAGGWKTYDSAPPGCAVTVAEAGIRFRANAVLRPSEARWLALRLAEAAALREVLWVEQPTAPELAVVEAPLPVYRCGPCKLASLMERGAVRTAVRSRSLHDDCQRGACACGCIPSRAARCRNCDRYGLPMTDGACTDIGACAAEMLRRGVDASKETGGP